MRLRSALVEHYLLPTIVNTPPIPQETTMMENTLNVAATASFSKSSNTDGMATNNHKTIDFEIEYMLLMNEPLFETNYNYYAVEMILTNNATARAI